MTVKKRNSYASTSVLSKFVITLNDGDIYTTLVHKSLYKNGWTHPCSG